MWYLPFSDPVYWRRPAATLPDSHHVQAADANPILPHHQCNQRLEEVSYLGQERIDPSQARSNPDWNYGSLHLLTVSLARFVMYALFSSSAGSAEGEPFLLGVLPVPFFSEQFEKLLVCGVARLAKLKSRDETRNLKNVCRSF